MLFDKKAHLRHDGLQTVETHASFLYHNIVIMLVVLFQEEQNDLNIRYAIVKNLKHSQVSHNDEENKKSCQRKSDSFSRWNPMPRQWKQSVEMAW